MKISKTASYSLNILSFMAASEERRMSAAFLNKRLKIPYPYLRRLLVNLSKNGLISSTKGRKGGFVFNRRTDTITLSDILEATDGLDGFKKCILGFSDCPFDTKCAMHDIWEEIRNSILTVLKSTSLKDISKKRKKTAPEIAI